MEFYYNDNWYNPENLETVKQRSLRSEYNRLRKEANRRLKTLKSRGYQWTNIYKSNNGVYDQNINRMSNRDLRYAITEVHDFLSSTYSDVEWMDENRARTIKSMRDKGITGLDESNFDRFVAFMEDFRALYGDLQYSSDYIAEYWLAEEDISPAHAWDMYQKYESNNSK